MLMREIIKKTRSKLCFIFSAPEGLLKRDFSPKKSQRQQCKQVCLLFVGCIRTASILFKLNLCLYVGFHNRNLLTVDPLKAGQG